jgi:hypothetical protein
MSCIKGYSGCKIKLIFIISMKNGFVFVFKRHSCLLVRFNIFTPIFFLCCLLKTINNFKFRKTPKALSHEIGKAKKLIFVVCIKN